MKMELCPAYYAVFSKTHTLIAGTTGSGKSVLIKGALNELIKQAEKECDYRLCLIDSKKGELVQYKQYSYYYADTQREIIKAVHNMRAILDNRFKYMKRHGLTEHPGAFFYIIIDEFADLMGYKKEILEDLSHIACLGRTGRVFLIISTQLPGKVCGLSSEIEANLVTRIALRCATPTESKKIIFTDGAEKLPLYGICYILEPGEKLFKTKVPNIEQETVQEPPKDKDIQNGDIQQETVQELPKDKDIQHGDIQQETVQEPPKDKDIQPGALIKTKYGNYGYNEG